jgi:hypothetical protein
MSEVVPEDEDRGGDGAIGKGLEKTALEGADDEPEEEGGTGADDGGPGSQNM